MAGDRFVRLLLHVSAYATLSACPISKPYLRPSAIPSAIALATVSASSGASLSRGFHERAIWRARLRSPHKVGGHLIGIPNSTTQRALNYITCTLNSHAFRSSNLVFYFAKMHGCVRMGRCPLRVISGCRAPPCPRPLLPLKADIRRHEGYVR